MSAPLKRMTAVQMPYASIWKDHTTALVNRDFLEMERTVKVERRHHYRDLEPRLNERANLKFQDFKTKIQDVTFM